MYVFIYNVLTNNVCYYKDIVRQCNKSAYFTDMFSLLTEIIFNIAYVCISSCEKIFNLVICLILDKFDYGIKIHK